MIERHEAAERSRDSNAFPLVSASVCHLSSHFLQEKSFSLLSVRISRKTQSVLDYPTLFIRCT